MNSVAERSLPIGQLFLILTVLFIVLTACITRVSFGEKADLREGSTVAIDGADLRIRLDDVGHGWYASGGHFPIVFLTIWADGPPEQYQVEEYLILGEYKIDILNSSESEGKCTLVISKR